MDDVDNEGKGRRREGATRNNPSQSGNRQVNTGGVLHKEISLACMYMYTLVKGRQ